jgi:nucleotide-binding universal stress UspA family protein
VVTNILAGIQFIEVIKDVLKNDRDLVVKSPNQERWFKRLVGSNDMHLLRKCPCPVLLLKSEMTGPCQKILATVDVSDSVAEQEKNSRVQEQLNRQVLEFSSSFALADSAELHIGSVWDLYGEDFLRYGAFSQMTDESVDKYVEKARREVVDKIDSCVREMNSYVGKEAINYIQPRLHLVKGLPAKEIPIMAKKYDIDLIVMGTIARTGIPGLIIGNTAESILEQVNCSVLAIKPEGFRCPVKVR